MIVTNQFASSPTKNNAKSPSEERSKTPNKKPYNKIGQRESKSLAKR